MNAVIHRIREYLTYLVAIYFIFPTVWGSSLVGIWALSCILSGIFDFKNIHQRDIWRTLGYSIPFFLILVSIWLHPNNGKFLIERSLSFLIFPTAIFLCMIKAKKKEILYLLSVFSIGCVFLAVKGIAMYIFIKSSYQYDIQHDFMFRFRQEFNTNTGISPTYASMYFAFAIFALLLLKTKTGISYIWFLVAGFLLTYMILLSAKMPMLALMVVGVLLFLKKDISFGITSRKIRIFVSATAIIGLIVISVFTRWNEIFTAVNYSSANPHENSVGIRGRIMQCNLELSKQHFLRGVGPQNLQKELNQCYYQFEGNDFERHEFNTHNQFFDYLLSHGVSGLFILLAFLSWSFREAWKEKDPLLLSFVLLTSVCMLTENILNRQQGIVFFCFFNAWLLNRQKDLDPGFN